LAFIRASVETGAIGISGNRCYRNQWKQVL